MTAFAYRAARPDGETVRGVVQATTRTAALAELSSTDLLVLDVREETGERGRNRRYRRAELATALSGLAALLDAGLPLDRALIVTADAAHVRLRSALADVVRRVRAGAALSQAMALSGACPDAVVATIRAGEANGRLNLAVRGAADQLARDADLASQLRAALAYPVFLLVSGATAIVIIVAFVVPRFASLLGDLGQNLPASTRLLMAVASAASQWWPIAPAAALLALIALTRWRATRHGRLTLDRLLLEVPLMGGVMLQVSSSRMCRTLGSLLTDGVPALGAMEHAGAAAGNAELRERMLRARGAVSEGEKVWGALRRHAVLTDAALQLIRFGEESGQLGLLAIEAGRQEETAAYRTVRAGVGLVEPVLVVAFGAVVAFVALALLQAVYAVRPAAY